MRFAVISAVLLLSSLSSVSILAQDQPVATEQWRPLYHFTPLTNWTNDPNGLLYMNGVYHLYNQQNPFENKWGHMSWGHATSTDLVHWKHLPVAIPEVISKDTTTWIYSGSSVWDQHNTSGFGKADGCLVAIYTADQPTQKKESQFIAYSNDGGLTFTNYQHNPVIDLHKSDFRDPNVTWNDQLHQWLMVVASPRENMILFYTSPNLKDWSRLSDFGPAGKSNGIWECPSLIQLPVQEGWEQVQGTLRKKWVLMTSFGGASKPIVQYFVGDFDGKRFINDNPADTVLIVDQGDCFYAPIPWNNAPHDQKILIGWLQPGSRETYPWKGQMSIPRDLSLVQTSKGLRLVQQPSAVIKAQLPTLADGHIIDIKGKKVLNTTLPIWLSKSKNAYWIETAFTPEKGATAGFTIAAKKDEQANDGHDHVSGINITYDEARHLVLVDKQAIDLSGEPALTTVQLEILVDGSSLEVFVNHGRQVLSTNIFPDKDATGLFFFSQEGNTVIRELKVWDLSHM